MGDFLAHVVIIDKKILCLFFPSSSPSLQIQRRRLLKEATKIRRPFVVARIPLLAVLFSE